MNKELQKRLDERLSFTPAALLNEDYPTHWRCYADCKEILHHYEVKIKPLSIKEWHECINYITKKLNI